MHVLQMWNLLNVTMSRSHIVTFFVVCQWSRENLQVLIVGIASLNSCNGWH